MEKGQMSKQRAEGLAGLYVNETHNRDISKLTPEHLMKVLSGCIIPLKLHEVPQAREAIIKIITEANGQPIGCERE